MVFAVFSRLRVLTQSEVRIVFSSHPMALSSNVKSFGPYLLCTSIHIFIRFQWLPVYFSCARDGLVIALGMNTSIIDSSKLLLLFSAPCAWQGSANLTSTLRSPNYTSGTLIRRMLSDGSHSVGMTEVRQEIPLSKFTQPSLMRSFLGSYSPPSVLGNIEMIL